MEGIGFAEILTVLFMLLGTALPIVGVALLIRTLLQRR